MGRFSIYGEVRAPEPLVIGATKRGYFQVAPVRAPAGTSGLVVSLPRCGSIFGQVLLDHAVTPRRQNLQVSAQSEDTNHEWPLLLGPLRSDGETGGIAKRRLELRDVPPGFVTVSITLNGKTITSIPNVLVESGVDTRDPRLNPLDLRQHLRMLKLTLRSSQGELLERSTAKLFLQDGISTMRGTTSRAGEIDFLLGANQSPDTIAVRGFRAKNVDWEPSRQIVVLQPAAAVRVVLDSPLVHDGKPVELLASLHLADDQNHELSLVQPLEAKLDPQTGAIFRVSQPGQYAITWRMVRGSRKRNVEISDQRVIRRRRFRNRAGFFHFAEPESRSRGSRAHVQHTHRPLSIVTAFQNLYAIHDFMKLPNSRTITIAIPFLLTSTLGAQASLTSARAKLQSKDYAGAAAELGIGRCKYAKQRPGLDVARLLFSRQRRLRQSVASSHQGGEFRSDSWNGGIQRRVRLCAQRQERRRLCLVGKSTPFGRCKLESDAGGYRPELDSIRSAVSKSSNRNLPTQRRHSLKTRTILHDHYAESANAQFGWVARALGDVDGDGITDYASTAPYQVVNGVPGGAVFVYSGKSGKLLYRKVGKANELFGWTVGPGGDVNGDGHHDFAIGGPGRNQMPGSAYLYSGKNGKLLRSWTGEKPGDRFGQDIRTVGDNDGDGAPDLLIGAPKHDKAGKDAGRAYLVSGKTGKNIHIFDGIAAGDEFGGGGVAGYHDDKQKILVVSAVNAGPRQQGRVYAFDGKTFEPHFVIDALPRSQNLGWFLSIVGDVDADGYQDVYATDWHDSTTFRGAGRAVVCSGKDGTQIHSLHGTRPGEGYGIGMGNAGDVDKDGHDDLIVGAWLNAEVANQCGKIYIHSGKDGSVLGTLTGAIAGDVLGFDAVGIGDVNGDETPDFLVTSAYNAHKGTKAGRTYVVSGDFCKK